MQKIFTTILLSTLFSPYAGALTRAELFEGCKIPENRTFALSESVSACEDFYQYVCSETTKSFTLPKDRSRWTFSFTDAIERLLYAKKNYFRNIGAGYTPSKPRAAQVKDFYLACMDEKASAKEEQEFVKREVDLISKMKTADELADLAQSRIDDGSFTYLDFGTYADQDNPDKRDLILEANVQSLPERSYYEKKEALADLEDLALLFFKTIGQDQPEQRAKWVVQFENDLLHKRPLPAEMHDRYTINTYKERKDILARYPHLKLERFFKRIPGDIRVRVPAVEALEFFETALTTLPLEQLKSVYLYHAARRFMDDAYPEYFAKYFQLQRKYFGGPEVRPDRQERCTKDSMRRFGMEIDEELISILFPNFPEKKVSDLVQKIRTSILEGLKKNTWLSADARKEALLKIEKAPLFLVKPKTEKDWNFNRLGKYDTTKPYSNRHTWEKLALEKSIDELSEPRSRSRWSMGPLATNAYYSPADNKFVLLQGVLLNPFFSPQSSLVENLAAIGSVVGHELGHSIDDHGARYNWEGKIKSWMTEKDLATFNARTSVLIEQFQKVGHDGKLTLGENIGDNVGLGFAFNAAFPKAKNAKKSDLQKFYSSYARLWCSVSRPEEDQMRLKTNPHALEPARVNQQVIHQEGFYKAFGCKEGDKMFLPESARVHLW